MKSAHKTDEFFHSYAEGFDSIYGNDRNFFNLLVNKLLRSSIRRRLQATINGCIPIAGKTVLDIGCGPGHYAVELAKRGATEVLGIDFAEDMLKLARHYANEAEVDEKCRFELTDFMDFEPLKKFDYTIVMGVLDYIAEPAAFIKHVIESTERKAFFSFPKSRHWLTPQRRLRYKFKCDLYLYKSDEITCLFQRAGDTNISIKDLGRDYFVTWEKPNNS